LPVPLLPSAMMFSRRSMNAQRPSSSTSILLAPDRGEVEGVEALHRREPGGADAALDDAALPVDQFQFHHSPRIFGCAMSAPDFGTILNGLRR